MRSMYIWEQRCGSSATLHEPDMVRASPSASPEAGCSKRASSALVKRVKYATSGR
jgi:hypothetical protein